MGLVLVCFGQLLLVGRPVARTGAVSLWTVGLLVLLVLNWVADGIEREPVAEEDRLEWAWTTLRAGLFVFIVAASVVISLVAPGRAVTDRSLDVIVLWSLSITALVIAALDRPLHRPGKSTWGQVRGHRFEIAAVLGLMLAAAILRLHDLSGTPWAMSGDEGTFAVTARDALDGSMTNPFNSGIWGYPSAVFMAQGSLIELFGESVGAARLLSALLGIGSVLAVYALVRHHLGRETALVALALTAAFNFHVYWSRNAQDAAASMFFIPVALIFLDRGLMERRRIESLAAGLVIGVAQFFHPANRILIPIAVAYVVYAMGVRYTASRSGSRGPMREVGVNATWIGLGVIVGHLPLAAYFWDHPAQFWDRINQVSVFASGWLEREHTITGDSRAHILLIQFKDAVLLPFSTIPHGHFRPVPPLVGWPMAVPAAVGMVVATARARSRRYFGFALAFWATVVGLALTSGPPETNRYVSAAPFLTIFAAIGIVSLARIAARLAGVPRPFVLAAALLSVGLISVWHVNYIFRDSRQISIFSDPNTEVTNALAREVRALGPGLTVYFSGPPRIYYEGFQNISYIAPGADGIDVDLPWLTNGRPPTLTGPTLFTFLPERIDELEIIKLWFPDGERNSFSSDEGVRLYDSYLVIRDG